MPVQSINIHKTAVGDIGIDFGAAGSSWTVGPGVVVASDLGNGVRSTYADSTLINYGTIASSSPSGYGIQFLDDGGSIFNSAGACISGYSAVAIGGANDETVNLGSIVGETI